MPLRSLYVNPAFSSVFHGVSVLASLDQTLKLWPDFRKSTISYVSIPAMLGAGVGFFVGMRSMNRPGYEEQNPFVRGWTAALKGYVFIFTFLLTEEIVIYCADPKHLDSENNCMVSETNFWSKFFPTPTALALIYAAWKTIPLVKRFEWSTAGGKKRIAANAADIFCNLLFYSRVIQMFLTNIFPPLSQPLLYELVAVPVAMSALGLQTRKPAQRETVDMVFRLGLTINLMFYLVEFLQNEFENYSASEEDSNLWSPVLKSISFAALFLMGIGYTCWKEGETLASYISLDSMAGETLLSEIDHTSGIQQEESIQSEIRGHALQEQEYLAQLRYNPEARVALLEQMNNDPRVRNLWDDPSVKSILIKELQIDEIQKWEHNLNKDAKSEEKSSREARLEVINAVKARISPPPSILPQFRRFRHSELERDLSLSDNKNRKHKRAKATFS